jgi:hypothetical protein
MNYACMHGLNKLIKIICTLNVVADDVVCVEPAAATDEEGLTTFPAHVREVLVDDKLAVAAVQREAVAPAADELALPGVPDAGLLQSSLASTQDHHSTAPRNSSASSCPRRRLRTKPSPSTALSARRARASREHAAVRYAFTSTQALLDAMLSSSSTSRLAMSTVT